jgi:putative hydrolase of the HAD superfamily
MAYVLALLVDSKHDETGSKITRHDGKGKKAMGKFGLGREPAAQARDSDLPAKPLLARRALDMQEQMQSEKTSLPISLADVRAVVFDAVGTLIDPDPPAANVYCQIGRRFGSQLSESAIAERFRQAFQDEEQRDRQNDWQTSESREVERWKNIVGRVLEDVRDPEACFRLLFEHFARPESWRCQAEAGPVLEALAGPGLILGLASNYDSRLRSVVEDKPELRMIKHLIISSEVGWRKPAEKFFAAVSQIVGQPADKILYVGDDQINDYQGATAAGLPTVLFDPREKQTASMMRRITRLNELLES